MAQGRRPTSADVARRAGVSRATVSYVLNNAPNQSIPEPTRQRVLEAAAELDYTPHVAAQTLRAGESKLVLFINTGVPYGTNLSVMIDALASDVAGSGRSLVLCQQRDPHDLAATFAHLQPALAITLGRLDVAQRAVLARARVPSVEAAPAGGSRVDAGAALQIRHLAACGHRRIGCVSTSDPVLAMFARPRLTGAQVTCAQLGLAEPVVAELPAVNDISLAELATVLREWTRGRAPVSAVACYNDVVAAACIAAADEVGLRVPGDLAVVGMDDEPMSAFVRPPLTTVRLHVIDFAHHVWAKAKAKLDGLPAPRQRTATYVSLIERGSA